MPGRPVPPRSPQHRVNGRIPDLDLELAFMPYTEPEPDAEPDVHELPEPRWILAGITAALAALGLAALGAWKLVELIARALG